MDSLESYQPEYGSLAELVKELAGRRALEKRLQTIVSRFSQRPHVALTRIWLIRPGDRCDACIHRDHCPDKTRCLHLVAGAPGEPLTSLTDLPGPTGDRQANLFHAAAALESDRDQFNRRIPLEPGLGPIGQVAHSGRVSGFNGLQESAGWLKENSWARPLNFVALGAAPLNHEGRVLGVLAVYSIIHLDQIPDRAFWVRTIAGLAAYTVALSQAFGPTLDRQSHLEQENCRLRQTASAKEPQGRIIGTSPAWQGVLSQVDLVAATEATVLISGPSGTGKELIARQIHRRSNRRAGPLIKINCEAIPDGLSESEFFGHRRGAFTGAESDRPGRFAAAHGGTLFLEEIAEIPLELQAKLLRVLQDGSFQPVGSDETSRVDLRIIAATKQDLKSLIRLGRFREDLFYRLNLFSIQLAPLKDRSQDIEPLARYFMKLAQAKFETGPLMIPKDELDLLENHPWPGNVRELRNAVERAVILADRGRLNFRFLDPELKQARQLPSGPDLPEVMTEDRFQELMRQNLTLALKRCQGKIYGSNGAAALVGLKPTTFTSRMKKLGIKRLNFESSSGSEDKTGV